MPKKLQKQLLPGREGGKGRQQGERNRRKGRGTNEERIEEETNGRSSQLKQSKWEGKKLKREERMPPA